VKWVVEGSALREGNQVRLTVKLIDAGTDHTVWSNTYLRDITNILRLQGELAQAIADNIRVEVAPQTRARFAQVRPVKREAEDLYLQGMLCLNTNQVERSLEFFQRAFEVDSDFAQPHAALAKAYGWLGESGRLAYSAAFSRQKSEATRAIELDDTLAEGHAELASGAMELNWDWAQAEREFRRALELNPGSVSVRMGYATYLMKTGNTSAAIAEVERCMKLDPLSEGLFQQAETIYFFSRKYDQTLAIHNRALARNFSTNHFVLGLVYREEGLYDKAIAEFRHDTSSPHSLGHLGNTYARAGQTTAANNVIEQLKAHIQTDAIGSYEIALVYAGLGNKDEAFNWLEKSLGQKDKGLVYLKVDPCLDPLRSDPRFNNLVQHVGLPL
jgi:tetratricopeptide (TPR) repeat protein